MCLVHTSFVLMQSLERTSNQPYTAVRFYSRRMFRIDPLAIGCVLVSFFIGRDPSTGKATKWTLRKLTPNLLLLENLTYDRDMVGGLWTLPLEVQMYAAAPLLYLEFVAEVYGCSRWCGLFAGRFSAARND